MYKTACFTGHRPSGFENLDDAKLYRIKSTLKQMVKASYSMGTRKFYSGGALGVDYWAACEVIEFRKTHPDVSLFIAIPFPSYQDQWNAIDKINYKNVFSRAQKIIEVDMDPYAAWKLQNRNEYMVDRSDYVLAICENSTGGTANCIKYALKKKRYTWVYNPGLNDAKCYFQ